MFERLQFLFVYVGSAALVAFLAACLSSPEIAEFTCYTSGANGVQRCELVATLPAASPAAGVAGHEVPVPEAPSHDLEAAALATVQ